MLKLGYMGAAAKASVFVIAITADSADAACRGGGGARAAAWEAAVALRCALAYDVTTQTYLARGGRRVSCP